MSTLTKEWLQKTIAELEEERDATPGAVNEDAANALAAMKLALASLEAEAAGVVMALVTIKGGFIRYETYFVSDLPDGDYELYTAPPAPVSVPEPIKRNDADGWWMYKGLRVGGGCAEWYNLALDDCRAAMLQGAEPVQGWIPCSERMPDEYDYDIWIYSPGKGVCHGVAYAGGGEFMDDECQFKIDDATHWMPMIMPAAPRQDAK